MSDLQNDKPQDNSKQDKLLMTTDKKVSIITKILLIKGIGYGLFLTLAGLLGIAASLFIMLWLSPLDMDFEGWLLIFSFTAVTAFSGGFYNGVKLAIAELMIDGFDNKTYRLTIQSNKPNND